MDPFTAYQEPSPEAHATLLEHIIASIRRKVAAVAPPIPIAEELVAIQNVANRTRDPKQPVIAHGEFVGTTAGFASTADTVGANLQSMAASGKAPNPGLETTAQNDPANRANALGAGSESAGGAGAPRPGDATKAPLERKPEVGESVAGLASTTVADATATMRGADATSPAKKAGDAGEHIAVNAGGTKAPEKVD